MKYGGKPVRKVDIRLRASTCSMDSHFLLHLDSKLSSSQPVRNVYYFVLKLKCKITVNCSNSLVTNLKCAQAVANKKYDKYCQEH